ncbi:MAG: 6-bladed beta-propeller [Balneolaceae bacterium]|nr:6-bladed beta-propeller [Balneolaceae bacterium]
MGRISGIAIDESERVYISESAQGHAAIHVFDTEGFYLTSLGGYGDGPGEFRSIIQPQIFEDELYALDGRQLKINIYSLQRHSFERSIQLDPRNWSHIERLNGTFPADFSVLDKNMILIGFLKSDDQKDLIYRYMMDSSGEIVSDMIIEQVLSEHFAHPNNRGIFHSPFSAGGLIAVSDHSTIYTIWTEEILFKEHTMEGEYQSAFYHPFTNKKLERDEALNLYDSEDYRASVRNTGIPERWPAVHSVVMDDLNNFWISTIIDIEDKFEWWILNQSGELISKFQWPKSKEIQFVVNGSAFILETEPESGLQKVVKYQFQFE